MTQPLPPHPQSLQYLRSCPSSYIPVLPSPKPAKDRLSFIGRVWSHLNESQSSDSSKSVVFWKFMGTNELSKSWQGFYWYLMRVGGRMFSPIRWKIASPPAWLAEIPPLDIHTSEKHIHDYLRLELTLFFKKNSFIGKHEVFSIVLVMLYFSGILCKSGKDCTLFHLEPDQKLLPILENRTTNYKTQLLVLNVPAQQLTTLRLAVFAAFTLTVMPHVADTSIWSWASIHWNTSQVIIYCLPFIMLLYYT